MLTLLLIQDGGQNGRQIAVKLTKCHIISPIKISIYKIENTHIRLSQTLPHIAGVSRLDTLSPALPLSVTNLPHHKNYIKIYKRAKVLKIISLQSYVMSTADSYSLIKSITFLRNSNIFRMSTKCRIYCLRCWTYPVTLIFHHFTPANLDTGSPIRRELAYSKL